VAGRRCSVVAVLVFFAALAGLVVRAYVTRRQGCQYMLVNGVLSSLSRAVRRLDGLGSRGLGPDASRYGTMARADVPASTGSGRPGYRLALPAARPAAREGL
jgi:hypothetical protein